MTEMEHLQGIIHNVQHVYKCTQHTLLQNPNPSQKCMEPTFFYYQMSPVQHTHLLLNTINQDVSQENVCVLQMIMSIYLN